MSDSLHDFEAFREADARFHREIALASGNTVLEDLLQSIRSLLRIWMDRGLADEGSAVTAAREHGEVLASLRRRDPAVVRAVMGAHMDTASRRLLEDFQPTTTD